ncbi:MULTISPECIES: hypothetical protein [Photobacterium]|jgi:hypothetical protein|uniref:Uncharacterized protein n=2 Tax=Photobacterium TaxID=657 RepID=A0A2T3JCL1_9GAMM|nr:MULTISPECIES: hypothetical protein [Photobacterium]PSU46626.1 hypothetical protein C9J12_18115 [Photobacterium frigidiphilum]PSV48257.1 hypothetical protein C9J47_06930 [Photobacterium indicum]
MKSPVDKLLGKHQDLIHTDAMKVTSHTHREDNENWFLHTLMIEGCDAPFKFKRKKRYKNLKGKLVNMTYYVDCDIVAGFEIETMRVVRIKLH